MMQSLPYFNFRQDGIPIQHRPLHGILFGNAGIETAFSQQMKQRFEIQFQINVSILLYRTPQSELKLNRNVTLLLIPRFSDTLRRGQFMKILLISRFHRHLGRLFKMNGKCLRVIIRFRVITQAATLGEMRFLQFDGIRQSGFVSLDGMTKSMRMKQRRFRFRLRQSSIGTGIRNYKFHTSPACPHKSPQCLGIGSYLGTQFTCLFQSFQMIDFQQDTTGILF